MDNGTIVVFSGFNQRAVIAFLRTLKRYNLPYVIVAKSDEDTILDTEYKVDVCIIREKLGLDIEGLLDIFLQIKKKTLNERLFISPSTEALNRILLEHTKILEKEGIIFPLVDKELYVQISDKYSFGQLCQKHGILTPKSVDNIRDILIPFVAKPYTYFTQNNKIYTPQLIYSARDKVNFQESFDEEDFYYQEFIKGRSFYLLYYFDKNGVVSKFSQENIAQQPEGKSIVAAKSSKIHKESISQKFEKMLGAIGFRGLIMIEIKKDDNKYYMIEANPRFWGPSQLFVDAGVNFFEYLLHDYGYLEDVTRPLDHIDSKYFWYGGILESQIKNQMIVFHSKTNMFHANELIDWLKSDVYRRTDTIKIFEKETLK